MTDSEDKKNKIKMKKKMDFLAMSTLYFIFIINGIDAVIAINKYILFACYSVYLLGALIVTLYYIGYGIRKIIKKWNRM